MTKRAALYARLSRDRSGEETATARQLEDCRAFAAARGWQVVGEYVDTDLSAYSAVSRPQYEALLATLDAGEADVVLSWKLDRLLRRPRDFEAVWARCEATGAHLATVRDGIDTTAPMVGKLLPRLMAIFAEMEGDNLSIREKRKHQETARAGRRSGGGHRPFGLTQDWSKLVTDEADAIRDAAARLVAGESMYAIVQDWNARGLRTPTGKGWTVQHFRSMAASPRLAGARLVGDELVITGAIPAILDVATFRRLQSAIRHPRPGIVAGKQLLAGLIVCGKCGSRMVTRRRHIDKRRYYGCEKGPGRVACGGVFITADRTEDVVRDMVLAAIDSPELATALAEQAGRSDDATLEQLRSDEAALGQLVHDHFVDGTIPRTAFLDARDALQGRIGGIRRRLERENGGTMLAAVVGTAERARDEWETRDMEWRRALLASVVQQVNITPKGKANAGRFDPNRIEVAWRY
jgi:site-specific DNA recombinase